MAIGRVGGLALLLGVGAAIFAGPACAESDPDNGNLKGSPASHSREAAKAGPAGPRPAGFSGSPQSAAASLPAKPIRQAGTSATARRGAAPRNSSADLPAGIAVSAGAIAIDTAATKPRRPAIPAAAQDPGPELAAGQPVLNTGAIDHWAANSTAAPVASAAAELSPTTAAPTSEAEVGAESDLAATGSYPMTSVDTPLAWAAVAEVRRALGSPDAVESPSSAADPAVSALEATGRSVGTFGDKGITAAPKVVLADGGNFIALLNAATVRDDVTLVFTGLGGSNGGKVTTNVLPNPSPTPGYNPQSAALLPYATWLDGGTRGTEQFRVGIREYTDFDRFFTNVPVIGDIVFKPVLHFLQDTPLISDLLAPIIGSSVVVPIDVDIAALAADRTLAFTYKVKSFDGTEISTNFFPSDRIATTGTAPSVIIGSGFGFSGQTAPYALYALKDEVPGVYTLRSEGYNVITYDPRGRFDSAGQVHMANPEYEGKDVSALVSWVAATTPAALNAPGDPKIGLVGGSYGAALQFASAADERIDAMVPVNGWDTLLESFYPNETFRTAYGALTILSLLRTGSRVYPPLYWAFGSGMLANWIGPLSTSLLNQSNPPLDQLKAPTLMIRGIVDVLFPLQQGTASAQTILANGNDVPLKMQWICTGHGVCNDPYGNDQTQAMALGTLSWLAQYVAGAGPFADSLPNFLWFDQNGTRYTSSLMPFQEGFNDLPDVKASAEGGLLPLVPILGGSGELTLTGIVSGTSASNAVTIDVAPEQLAAGTQVVGTPSISFSYRGLGVGGGAVYAQVVNKTTGLVLGNVVSPVPVRLDGFKHTVSVDIGEIAYTVGEGDSLQVQITGSATPFFNLGLGLIDISDLTVTLPNRTAP